MNLPPLRAERRLPRSFVRPGLGAVAALGLLGPGLLHAQSSGGVTIYGRLDMYVGQETENAGASNGGDVKLINSGGQSGSRLGFRGTEPLGAGWQARFTLEQGINADNGTIAQGGRSWGRQATVGVSGPLGSLDLGRRDSAYYDFRNGFVAIISTAAFDPVGAVFGETNPANVTLAGGVRTSGTATSSSIANTAIDGSSASASGDFVTRLDNYVHYESPRFGPAQFSLGYAMPEDRRVVGGKWGKGTQTVSATLNLRGQAWRVSLATQADKFRSSITSAGVDQGRAGKTVTALGASWDFGIVRVAAFVNRDEFRSPAGVKDRATEWAAGATVPLGRWTFNAMWAEGRIQGVDLKASGWGAQVLYEFSRRTDVYSAHRQNRDDNIPTTGTTVRTERVKDSLTGLGIRHRF